MTRELITEENRHSYFELLRLFLSTQSVAIGGFQLILMNVLFRLTCSGTESSFKCRWTVGVAGVRQTERQTVTRYLTRHDHFIDT